MKNSMDMKQKNILDTYDLMNDCITEVKSSDGKELFYVVEDMLMLKKIVLEATKTAYQQGKNSKI